MPQPAALALLKGRVLVVPAPQLKEKFFLALVAMRARVGTDEGLTEPSICASLARRHAIVRE